MKRTEASLMKMTKKELVELLLQEQVEDSQLGQKTKQELIDIILRKDDVETRLKETIKTKDEDINILNGCLIGYEADINGYNRMLEESRNNTKELEQALDRKRVVIRRWQITFAILAILSIIVIAVIA